MRKLILATALLLAAPVAASAQDLDNGKSVFNKCRACHQVGEGAKNVVGPILNGLQNRKSGTVEGYSYTDANKNSGLTWDEATFAEYIKNPKAKIPNTKMVFAGLTDEKDIKDLWAYITNFGADGKAAK